MPSHDIIDNRNRALAPEIVNFMADSVRAHLAVGYFFLSGFQAIAAQIPHLEQLRLLIGNVTNRRTIEQLAEGYGHLGTVQRTPYALCDAGVLERPSRGLYRLAELPLLCQPSPTRPTKCRSSRASSAAKPCPKRSHA